VLVFVLAFVGIGVLRSRQAAKIVCWGRFGCIRINFIFKRANRSRSSMQANASGLRDLWGVGGRPNLHIPQRADSYAELVVAALNAAVEQVRGEYQ
jgi:hypothetical protein